MSVASNMYREHIWPQHMCDVCMNLFVSFIICPRGTRLVATPANIKTSSSYRTISSLHCKQAMNANAAIQHENKIQVEHGSGATAPAQGPVDLRDLDFL